MSTIKIEFHHFVAENKVKERSRLLLKELAHEHKTLISDLKEEWNGNEGKFNFLINKKNISGKINSNSHPVINIEIEIPFQLFLLRSNIKKMIQNKMNQVYWYDQSKKYQFKTL